MNSNRVNGFVAEKRMSSLAKELFDVWDSPSVKEIVEIVERYKPGYVNTVMDYLTREGFDHINQVPVQLLADSLLGLDCVFSLTLKSKNKINIGVDVTTYDEAIFGKKRKLTDFKPQLKEVGINRCLVIKWEVDKFPHEWTEEDKQVMRKQITNALFISPAWVKELTLTL